MSQRNERGRLLGSHDSSQLSCDQRIALRQRRVPQRFRGLGTQADAALRARRSHSVIFVRNVDHLKVSAGAEVTHLPGRRHAHPKQSEHRENCINDCMLEVPLSVETQKMREMCGSRERQYGGNYKDGCQNECKNFQ